MFVDSSFVSSQREKRLELSKTQNTERRPTRVSSLRRKPSDPKTSWSSISRGAGHQQSLEPSIRPSAGLRGSEEPRRTSPPLSSSTDGTRRPLRSRPRQQPQDTQTSQSPSSPVRRSPDSSTLKPPHSPPPPAPEETPEEVRRPKSKPPLPPKPRIPAEPMFWSGPKKTTRAGPAPPPSPRPRSRPAPHQETSIRGEEASADPTPPIRRLQEEDEEDVNLLSSREEVKVQRSWYLSGTPL